MLVPFVIDADSLAPDPAWPPPVVRSCHRDLLDMWQRIGLLVHDGESFEDSSLGQAVNDLPQSLKMLWQAVLERSPPIPCRNDWNGSVTPSAAMEICNVASLALLDDTHAEVDFGIEEDQDETSIVPADNHRVIVARLIAANNVSVVKEAFHTSRSNIQAGERYQDVWNTRFRSLASAPNPNLKKVSIVDRYAVEQHFRCPQDRLSGFERFLRLLDSDAGGARYVTLYSAWTADLDGRNGDDVEAEMSALMQKLPKTNVRRLRVHMAPNHAFGKHARDRYVRFGRYVWELGHGVDIFEGPAAGHFCQASFKSDSESHMRIEQELERETKPSAIDIKR